MSEFLKKGLITLNIVGALSCIGLFSKFVLMPPIIERIYSQEYKIKMAACDGAMRGHLIAKNRVISEKSRDALDNLQMAEVALLDCHEYDKLRKRLISFGLSSNDLAKIGLEAIEEKKADLNSLVEIHEFKF